MEEKVTKDIVGEKSVYLQILEVKAEIFDLLKRREQFQIAINQLNKVRIDKIKKLNELERKLKETKPEEKK